MASSSVARPNRPPSLLFRRVPSRGTARDITPNGWAEFSSSLQACASRLYRTAYRPLPASYMHFATPSPSSDANWSQIAGLGREVRRAPASRSLLLQSSPRTTDFAMANKRFGVGDEVASRGAVRLVDAARDGTVTRVLATWTRVTLYGDSGHVDLVAPAKRESFTKAPKGRQKRLIPDSQD